MTARAPDSNLEGKKLNKNNIITPTILFTVVQKPFTAKYDWDEIAELRPEEGNADFASSSSTLEHIRAVRPAGAAHMATVKQAGTGQVFSTVKVARTEYLDWAVQIFVVPDTVAATQSWRVEDCL